MKDKESEKLKQQLADMERDSRSAAPYLLKRSGACWEAMSAALSEGYNAIGSMNPKDGVKAARGELSVFLVENAKALGRADARLPSSQARMRVLETLVRAGAADLLGPYLAALKKGCGTGNPTFDNSLHDLVMSEKVDAKTRRVWCESAMPQSSKRSAQALVLGDWNLACMLKKPTFSVVMEALATGSPIGADARARANEVLAKNCGKIASSVDSIATLKIAFQFGRAEGLAAALGKAGFFSGLVSASSAHFKNAAEPFAKTSILLGELLLIGCLGGDEDLVSGCSKAVAEHANGDEREWVRMLRMKFAPSGNRTNWMWISSYHMPGLGPRGADGAAGFTPMDWAVARGDANVVETLLKHGHPPPSIPGSKDFAQWLDTVSALAPKGTRDAAVAFAETLALRFSIGPAQNKGTAHAGI